MNREYLKEYVQERLDDADIRIDQCEIVRVYWRGMYSGIRETDEGIIVMVFLRPAPGTPDFFADPCIKETTFDELEAGRKLVHRLKRVKETDIDSPDAWET